MGTCYSCNSRHSTPLQKTTGSHHHHHHHRVAPLNRPLPDPKSGHSACSPSEFGSPTQSPCCIDCPSNNARIGPGVAAPASAPASATAAPGDDLAAVGQPASSSGYVTGKSPLDTSASRFSDSTWTSENHPDFVGPQQPLAPCSAVAVAAAATCGGGGEAPLASIYRAQASATGGVEQSSSSLLILTAQSQPSAGGHTHSNNVAGAPTFTAASTANGKMSSYPPKKSLFDTPQQAPQSLKCDLNLNNRPRLTSDYAQASQAALLHSQPQSYATRRGILSYRRLEPMFPRATTDMCQTATAAAAAAAMMNASSASLLKHSQQQAQQHRNSVASSSSTTITDNCANAAAAATTIDGSVDFNANRSVTGVTDQPAAGVTTGAADGAVLTSSVPNQSMTNNNNSNNNNNNSNACLTVQRSFFHPADIKNDKEVISSVLEFLKSPTAAGLSGGSSHASKASLDANANATSGAGYGRPKLGGTPRAIRPTTLDNLKACTPKMPIKFHRPAVGAPAGGSGSGPSDGSSTYRSPRLCRKLEETAAAAAAAASAGGNRDDSSGLQQQQQRPRSPSKRQMSPLRIIERSESPQRRRSPSRQTAQGQQSTTDPVVAAAAAAERASPLRSATQQQQRQQQQQLGDKTTGTIRTTSTLCAARDGQMYRPAWSPVKTERFFSRDLHLQRHPATTARGTTGTVLSSTTATTTTTTASTTITTAASTTTTAAAAVTATTTTATAAGGAGSPEQYWSPRRQSNSPERQAGRPGSGSRQYSIGSYRSPGKSPAKTPLSHQSSVSLNSDILERVEGLIDDDFVDQPSLIASSKNSLDSETSRCSVNLQLQSLGMGMNRGMLMYHELARIKEQLLILRTTLEHCIVDEPEYFDDNVHFLSAYSTAAATAATADDNDNVLTRQTTTTSAAAAADDVAVTEDLRRQLVLLNEELKGRDATIRKLQQQLESKRITTTLPSEEGNFSTIKAVRNVAVQTSS